MTSLQIGAGSVIGASNYNINFYAPTESHDKTYSIEITKGGVTRDQSIYYDGDGNKKLNLNGNVYDIETGLDIQVGGDINPMTFVLKSTNGSPYYIRPSSNTNSVVGRMCIGNSGNSAGGFVVNSNFSYDVYNTEKVGLAVDMLISFDTPSSFGTNSLELSGGLNAPTFTYNCTKENGNEFSLKIVAKDTVIVDADGIVYSKTLIIDNGDGSPIENFDLTSNVTFDAYQESSLVQNPDTGKWYIDPETAWNLGQLLQPTDRNYDGFRFFIISINDLLDFGGYIVEGGSPDDYLTVEDTFRRARTMSMGAVTKYDDLKVKAKYKKPAGKKIKSNLKECFEKARQEENIRQAIRALKTNI